jgi:RNA polymerase sigma-70 factor (ECF subfamily)
LRARGTLWVMRDGDAFSAMYVRDGERVLVFLARRTLDVELAFDLTAETFAIALGSWGRLRKLEPEQVRAWLFTVARRQHGRYLRRARVERRALQRLGIQVPAVDEDDLALIEERAGLVQLRGVVAEELEALSDGQQEALRLRVVEERPYAEVASLLRITEQAARARVARGLRALSSALDARLQLGKELS